MSRKKKFAVRARVEDDCSRIIVEHGLKEEEPEDFHARVNHLLEHMVRVVTLNFNFWILEWLTTKLCKYQMSGPMGHKSLSYKPRRWG